jgi:hypothetical protein
MLAACTNHALETSMTAQEKVRRCLEEMIEEADTPGVQYIMLSADSILFSFTGGLAHLEPPSSFSDSTTLHAFSVTKTFTASFAESRKRRLEISGNPAQYDDLNIFLEEQKQLISLLERSILLQQTIDISDNDKSKAVEKIADWLNHTGGLYMLD